MSRRPPRRKASRQPDVGPPSEAEAPPVSGVFDEAARAHRRWNKDSIGWAGEREQVDALKELVERARKDDKRSRSERFYPYLLIRFGAGDRGDRPINVPFWESPDIWTADGAPDTTPDVPSTVGGIVTAGVPNTLYAHVFNLGKAPIAGVKVDFFWVDPTLGASDATVNPIGTAQVDLAPRSSPHCHRLVKCPAAWVPTRVNDGHECLIVRVSAIGDAVNASDPWAPWADRHVAQRNITVLGPGAEVAGVLKSLEKTRPPEATVQLLQVGRQAQPAVGLVRPGLTIATSVHTHVLAELDPAGRLSIPATRSDAPAAQAAAHPRLQAETEHAPPSAVEPLGAARLDLGALVGNGDRSTKLKRTQTHDANGSIELASSGAALPDLLAHEDLLTKAELKKVRKIEPPGANNAQVLRFAAVEGGQLTGGYTVVIADPASRRGG